MAYTYSKLATYTVGSGGISSIDFLNIPQNYTDLVVKVSARSTRTAGTIDYVSMSFNGSTANRTLTALWGDGTAYSGTDTKIIGSTSTNSNTSNTFGSAEFYIPNYAGSNNKSVSVDAVSENNSGTTGDYNLQIGAGLWSITSAITSISLTSNFGNNWVQYSTAHLYGIKAEL
jgi:hypothetical protein